MEEVPRQTLGLVLANRPAASRPPLSPGRGKMTRKFGALEESCASGEPSGGEGPEESVRRSLPGGADPGEVSERATGAALRSAPTCAPPAKWRGLARLGGGGGGGGRDAARSGFQRGPAETPVPPVFAAMRRKVVSRGLPRLSRNPGTGPGLGRGRAGVGQGWKGKETYELLPPRRRIPSGSLLQKRSKKGREGRHQRWGAAGKPRTPFLGSPLGLATLRHWLGSVVWVVSARRRSRGIPEQRRGRDVSGR